MDLKTAERAEFLRKTICNYKITIAHISGDVMWISVFYNWVKSRLKIHRSNEYIILPRSFNKKLIQLLQEEIDILQKEFDEL